MGPYKLKVEGNRAQYSLCGQGALPDAGPGARGSDDDWNEPGGCEQRALDDLLHAGMLHGNLQPGGHDAEAVSIAPRDRQVTGTLHSSSCTILHHRGREH